MNLSKEEIEKVNKILSCDNCPTSYACEGCDITWTDKQLLKKYINKLEQENNKQNKIIDEMAMEIASSDNYDTFYKRVCLNNNCEGNGIPCWDCVKQYFEKKVEEK